MISRIEKIYPELEKLCINGFLVSDQTNISYLTDYPTRDAYLLISFKENFIFTDFRYFQEYKTNLKNFTIIKTNGSGIFNSLKKIVAKVKIKRLGFESRNLVYGEYKILKQKLPKGIEFIETQSIIENLRAIKDKKEIQKIKKAVSITIKAFEFIKKILRPGIKELDLAAEIERFIRLAGARTTAFELIVASGPNTSLPHAITSTRLINNNEVALVDLGVDYEGYKSDLTRTFFLGKISPDIVRTYSFVRQAQEKAINKIKPGLRCNQIDYAARSYLKKLGYAKFFGHSLGHGLGLAVHENPSISSKNTQILKENMVFTVEPAVYLPGKFGLRIEDMVLVIKNGCEVLSGALDK